MMRRSRRISYLTQSYETNSGQEKGARSKTTQGEGIRSTSSWSWESPLDRRLRTRMATRPIQFTGTEERHTPKCELLRTRPRVDKSTPSTIYLSYPGNHVSHPVNSLKPNLTEAKP